MGSAIAATAEKRGYEVTVIEKDDYHQHVGRSADLLINANGNSKKFLAAQDPAQEFDLSVRSVERSIHDFNVRRYVHLSSIDVYPDFMHPARNKEDSPIEPDRLSPYGFHKYLAEQLVRYYAKSWLLFRMGGFVGPRLWKNSIYDLLKGRPIRVNPDSEYQYLHTFDLARIVLECIEAGIEGEIFNICGDGTISLRSIAAMIPQTDVSMGNPGAAREHYEINVDKIKTRCALPRTGDSVRRFVTDVLSGKETLT